MKAILVRQSGGIDQLHLEDVSVPECGPKDVLVKLKAVGINFIDIYVRKGLYKTNQFPYIPGKEGSGEVVSVGKDVQAFKPGDRVAFCAAGTGTYAEYAAIPADQVVLIPASLSFETAAAVMLQGLTAYYLSHQTFLLSKNHVALIHAGAGGVGLLLIQMAKLVDAKVITTVSNEEKAKLAMIAGADEVVIYTQNSFLEAVKKITNGTGVNVVYDSVGKTTFEDSLIALAIRGMLVSYGQSSGPVLPIELSKLAEKSLFLTRPTLFHYIKTKEELDNMSLALFDLISNNKLQVTIGKRYPLEEVATAHLDLENRKTIGKSILLI